MEEERLEDEYSYEDDSYTVPMICTVILFRKKKILLTKSTDSDSDDECEYMFPLAEFDGNGSVLAFISRELRERFGIDADFKSLTLVHCSYVKLDYKKDVVLNLFFVSEQWNQLEQPEEAMGVWTWGWGHLDDLPEGLSLPHRLALESISKNVHFGELIVQEDSVVLNGVLLEEAL